LPGGRTVFLGSHYLHITDGRLRIKIAELKRSPRRASSVERELRATKGVRQVKANPLTGNLLVLFEPGITSHQQIINHLGRMGFRNTQVPGRTAGGAYDGLSRALSEMIIKFAIEAALTRLILVLI
jgi:cation transport ATPase